MSIELKASELVTRIERLATERTELPEQVLANAVQSYLDNMEKEAIHAETETFWAMHADLVERYAHEHIALYKGQVVDHDRDVAQLEARIREQFGMLPVLIALVKPELRHDILWRGGRWAD